MEKKFGFPKEEHLTSKLIIDRLYKEGASVVSFPLRAVFIPLEPQGKQPTAAILINVAKKRFRHAVDRNLLKRRIREAYRLNKSPFIEELGAMGKNMAVAILYIDNRHSSTEYLKKKMVKLLAAIIEKEKKECTNS
ncbi:MAG: ribonuclease P protein component [Bacteroidaceae bacterium]|nr:ribonuclease P protein component [Bacteroidaceae bacterium]